MMTTLVNDQTSEMGVTGTTKLIIDQAPKARQSSGLSPLTCGIYYNFRLLVEHQVGVRELVGVEKKIS